MRLTLRTLLAYHDEQPVSESSRDRIESHLQENQTSQELRQRIINLAAQPRMAAPNVHVAGTLDPNNVAQYIDNSLAAELCPQFERSCLKSDSALAEVAAVHQIVCRMAEQPANISPRLRDRIYQTPNELNAGPKSSDKETAPVPPAKIAADKSSVSTLSESRHIGRKALASAANALSGISGAFANKATKDNDAALAAAPTATANPIDKLNTSRPSTEEDEAKGGYGRWIVLAIVLLLWLSVWVSFPQIQGSSWYQRLAARWGGGQPATPAESSNDSPANAATTPSSLATSDSLDLLAQQPAMETVADQQPTQTSKTDSLTPPSSLLPPPTFAKVSSPTQPESSQLPATASTASVTNVESPNQRPAIPALPAPERSNTHLAANDTPETATDLATPQIDVPALPPLMNGDETSSHAPIDAPALVGTDDQEPETASEESVQETMVADTSSETTGLATPDLPAFPGTELSSSELPAASMDFPVAQSTATDSASPAMIPGDAPAQRETETQLASAVRDLPPISEEEATTTEITPPTNTPLSPLAPIGLAPADIQSNAQPEPTMTLPNTSSPDNSVLPSPSQPLVPATEPLQTATQSQPVAPTQNQPLTTQPLTPNLPSAITTDSTNDKPTGGVSISNQVEVASPNLGKDADDVIQLIQQTAMVAVDQQWSLVLPGGIGKLKAKGNTGGWDLTFSGVSKLAATDNAGEPDIRVQRCFTLIQTQNVNETLRLRTPKGDLFLTAIKPNSEMVVEIRPYLPPGFTAAETQTRYMLGCLGVAGTFVVEHNQKEVALSSNDWLVVDTDGKANQLHENLPADIVQSIEYLKAGQPLPDVAELAAMLASPYGLTMLTDFASGHSADESSGSEQNNKRSLAGIWSYYLGRMEPIAHILNDPTMRNENGWNDHIDAVRDCLQSDPAAFGQLQSALGDLWNDEQLASRIVGYQAQTIKANVMSSLVDDLSNPGLARRVLAIHALQQLWQKDFGYDPMGETDSFKASISQWRQLLEDSLSSRIGVSPAPSLVPSTQR